VFSDAWFLARKDLEYMLRQKETLLWTFFMPVVFFFFIGTITGGFGGTAEDGPTLLAVENLEEGGFVGDHLVTRLETLEFRVVLADTAAHVLPRLTFPDAFTDSVLALHPATLGYAAREQDLTGDYDRFRVMRAVYTVLGDAAIAGDAPGGLTAAGLGETTALPRNLTVDIRPAGKRKTIPTGFSQAVPGTMVMFTLLIMLTSGAVLLVIERKEGLLRRLASTPIRRGAIVLGKLLARLALAAIQIGFAMILGSLAFGVSWGPDLPMLLVVLAVYAALTGILGILLGNLARTEGQAVGIGVIASNVLAALGGCWWPIEITPEWMQKLALFLPTGWAMDALHKLVNFNAGASSTVLHATGMLAVTLVLGWAAARTFRFQ
jgi:ABC-type Na+ efflux pump permease subunit